MLLDNIAVFVCVLLLLLAVWSLLSDTFLAKVDVADGDGVPGESAGSVSSVSVVVVSDNNASELAANLPVYLSQDYPAGYEVIVVVDRDEDGTGDVLKTFAGNPLLYTTFVPDSSRYMSRRKLAVTLGVKAAKNEWILLADAAARPASPKWIARMAASCRDGVDMVMGYSCFADETGDFKKLYRFHRAYSLLHEAQSGRAYGLVGCNLMFRKSMFMAGNGFLGNLKFLRGEYDFIVNEYAQPHRTAIAMSPEAHVVQDRPTRKKWLADHLFYIETRRHLRRSLSHRLPFNADTLLLHTNYVALIAAITYSSVTSGWLLLGVSLASLVATLLLRLTIASKGLKHIGEEMPAWAVLPMELRVAWQNLYFMLRHFFSDKQNFIRK